MSYESDIIDVVTTYMSMLTSVKYFLWPCLLASGIWRAASLAKVQVEKIGICRGVSARFREKRMNNEKQRRALVTTTDSIHGWLLPAIAPVDPFHAKFLPVP